ncbi:hypothetical protein IAT40_002112 [Kwoniella sp. CBS 6097]
MPDSQFPADTGQLPPSVPPPSADKVLADWAKEVVASQGNSIGADHPGWKEPPKYSFFLGTINPGGDVNDIGIEVGISLEHGEHHIPFLSKDIPWLTDCQDAKGENPYHPYSQCQDTVFTWDDNGRLPTGKYTAAARALYDNIIRAEVTIGKATEGYRSVHKGLAETQGSRSLWATTARARELQSEQTRTMFHGLGHRLYAEMPKHYLNVRNSVTDKANEESGAIEEPTVSDAERARHFRRWESIMKARAVERLQTDDADHYRLMRDMVDSYEPAESSAKVRRWYDGKAKKALATASIKNWKAFEDQRTIVRDTTTPWSTKSGNPFPGTFKALLDSVDKKSSQGESEVSGVSTTDWAFIHASGQSGRTGPATNRQPQSTAVARKALLVSISRALTGLEGDQKTVLTRTPIEQRQRVLGKIASEIISTIKEESRKEDAAAWLRHIRNLQIEVEDSDVKDTIRKAAETFGASPSNLRSTIGDLTMSLARLTQTSTDDKVSSQGAQECSTEAHTEE